MFEENSYYTTAFEITETTIFIAHDFFYLQIRDYLVSQITQKHFTLTHTESIFFHKLEGGGVTFEEKIN